MILRNIRNYLPDDTASAHCNTVLRSKSIATLCPTYETQGLVLKPKHHSLWTFDHLLLLQQKGEKVKFTLEQGMKAQRGSRGIALLFL
jgi:hypothetical protein